MARLMEEFSLGGVKLRNRVVMAPLTRGRATEAHVPTDIMREYYAQRASAGLIISEATGISRQGLGWYCAPGIWSDEQVEAWKPIVKAVHDKGAPMVLQLWHMGRFAHSDVTGEPIVSASEEPLEMEVHTKEGEKKKAETPHALTVEEIKKVVDDYVRAAKNAISAGFDLVEVHSANGYLLDQFLQSKTNKRTDEFGGSLENRLRLLKMVLEAVIEAVGDAQKVGVRFSPNGSFGEMGSPDNLETFTEAIKLAGKLGLAYVHVMDGLGFGFHELTEQFTLNRARSVLKDAGAAERTAVMGNCGYDKQTADERINSGDADLIAFGRPYLSNPDLVERFQQNLELAPVADMKYWYTSSLGAEGYTTWPTAKEAGITTEE